MRFVTDTLPSSKKEVEWYWQKTVQETFDLSNVMIKNKKERSYIHEENCNSYGLSQQS